MIDFGAEHPLDIVRQLTGGMGVKEIAPEASPEADQWSPGDAPLQALTWAVEALAKAGTLSIISVYPLTMRSFPIGSAIENHIPLVPLTGEALSWRTRLSSIAG